MVSTFRSNHPITVFQAVVFSVGLLCMLACAPEERLPAAPLQVASDQDDWQQAEDMAGDMPSMEYPTMDALERLGEYPTMDALERLGAAAKASGIRRAWLSPNPLSRTFRRGNSTWQTFEVRASSEIDSVYVLVNPQIAGVSDALEVAGGNTPPSQSFCPAEWNDSPTRARRNGWNLHLLPCNRGKTYVLLYGWQEGKLDLYNLYPITVK